MGRSPVDSATAGKPAAVPTTAVSAKKIRELCGRELLPGGIQPESLRNIGVLNAAPCALIGQLLATGRFKIVGAAQSGLIVVPGLGLA